MTNKNFQHRILQTCCTLSALSLFVQRVQAAQNDTHSTDMEVSAAPAAPSATASSASSVPDAAAPTPNTPEGTTGATPHSTSAEPSAPAAAASSPSTTTPAPASGSPPAVAIAPAASGAQLSQAQAGAAVDQPPPASATQAPAPPVVPPAPISAESKAIESLAEGYKISGYIQAQYESHEDSEDQLRQGGALINQNRFVLRRGRVTISRDWDYASLLLEMDGNTTKGPTFRWQRAEASLVYGRSREKGVEPILQFTMGMFNLPFGYELVESAKFRPFMERSTGGRALWPSEPDVGARLSGQLNFFRYAVSLTNGEPLDEKSGLGLQDPNKNKDVTIRMGAITKPWEGFTISGGVTYNAGKGFHPGTDATKNVIGWQDLNHDGVVQAASELTSIAGTSATPSQNFSRWALGADAQIALQSSIGKSTLYGEVVAAQNMDRGLYIADPVAVSGQNIREIAYYIGFLQEITPYTLVGFRTDYYNPDADFLDQQGGKLVPQSQAIRDYSPIIGLVLPDRARLLFEYDIQSNLLARDSRGVPARYPNNQWTLRLQVNL